MTCGIMWKTEFYYRNNYKKPWVMVNLKNNYKDNLERHQDIIIWWLPSYNILSSIYGFQVDSVGDHLQRYVTINSSEIWKY